MNEMSKTTTVTALMAMNIGFKFVAPMSEMYLLTFSTGFRSANKRMGL